MCLLRLNTIIRKWMSHFSFCFYPEFQKLWRGVSVEGQDERKIEEYLDKQGITSMQDVGLKKVVSTEQMSGLGENRSSGFLTRSDTNRPEQSQKA